MTDTPNLGLLARAVRSAELQARVQMACALLGVPFTEAEVILVVSQNITAVALEEDDLSADTSDITDAAIMTAIQETMTGASDYEGDDEP